MKIIRSSQSGVKRTCLQPSRLRTIGFLFLEIENGMLDRFLPILRL
jgi:hypothetical protein